MTEQTPSTVEDNLAFIADDLTTLGDVANRLRGMANQYDRMERQGWQLAGPVDGGRMTLVQKGN